MGGLPLSAFMFRGHVVGEARGVLKAFLAEATRDGNSPCDASTACPVALHREPNTSDSKDLWSQQGATEPAKITPGVNLCLPRWGLVDVCYSEHSDAVPHAQSS